MKKQVNRILLFSSFIWIVSNLHHPVTPSHFTNLNLPDHIFGTSYAAMVFSIFLTAPIWGSIGDKGYRIKALTISTFIYGIVQIGLSFATTVTSIIVVRSLAGMVSSGFHVGLMSALVDVSADGDRKTVMANYSAILSVSAAAGFLLGGLIGYLPSNFVFIIQGFCMIFISIGIKLFITETNAEERLKPHKETVYIWNILKDTKKVKETFSPWIVVFLAITFFVAISYSSNNNAFNYYLKAELNMQPIVNGIWKAITGVLGLIANLTINVWLIKRTNIKNSIIAVLAISSIFAFVIFFNNSLYPFMIFNLLFFINYTIQTPILQGFAVEDHVGDVGFMTGIYSAVKSLGEMVGSMVAGFSYAIYSKLPFLVAAIAISLAFLFSVFYYFTNKKGNIISEE